METVALPLVQLVEILVAYLDVVNIPVVIPMVQTVLLTMEMPLFALRQGCRCPRFAGRASSTGAGCDKDSLHPTVTDRCENRRDPVVFVQFLDEVVDMPIHAHVLVVLKTVEVPQLQLIEVVVFDVPVAQVVVLVCPVVLQRHVPVVVQTVHFSDLDAHVPVVVQHVPVVVQTVQVQF